MLATEFTAALMVDVEVMVGAADEVLLDEMLVLVGVLEEEVATGVTLKVVVCDMELTPVLPAPPEKLETSKGPAELVVPPEFAPDAPFIEALELVVGVAREEDEEEDEEELRPPPLPPLPPAYALTSVPPSAPASVNWQLDEAGAGLAEGV